MILVFGGEGQLGCELVEEAKAGQVRLTALGRGEADITDPAAVARAIAATSPSLIVNAAAYNAVDRAESDVETAMKVNATGPAILAAAAAEAGVPLVHISTDYVFDGEKGSPYVEDDPVAPVNAYGRSKAAGEEAVRERAAEHFILRPAWVFGAHGGNFLKTVLRLAAECDALDMVADQSSSPTAASDLATAILLLADKGHGHWGTYHVAGSGVTSRHAFASAIVAAQARFTGRNPPVRPIASSQFQAAARRPRNSALDSSKFAATFGFRPGDWREAVERTVARLLAGGTKP